MKILLPETEAQGFAGSEEQREEAAGSSEGQNPAATAGRRPPTDSLELRESKSGPALAARFCCPSYLIFMLGSREPYSVLHLENPVRYHRVPAERYRGLHTGSGNLPPGFPHPRRSWNRNPVSEERRCLPHRERRGWFSGGR